MTRQGWIAAIVCGLLLGGQLMAQPLDITEQLDRLMLPAGGSSSAQKIVPLMELLEQGSGAEAQVAEAEIAEGASWGGLSLDLWEGPKIRKAKKALETQPEPVSRGDSPVIEGGHAEATPAPSQVATGLNRSEEPSEQQQQVVKKKEEGPRSLVVPEAPEVLNLSPMLGDYQEEEVATDSQQMAEEGDPESLLDEGLSDLTQTYAQNVSDERYRLRIGDQFVVSIYGEPGTAREVIIDSTGAISYLLVGRVPALGKTIDELREELNRRIHRVFKYAFVTVTPSEFGGQYYTILGEVRNPGKKVLLGKTSVLSALCGAGGFREGGFRSQTIDLADLEHAFLARNGDYVPVNFKTLVIEGDMTQDVELLPGDYIYVPSALYKEIHILGAVNTPTTIGFMNVVTLSEAISQARGLRNEASSRVIIIRGSLYQPIRIEADVKRIFKGQEKDIKLQPGDIVFVPTRRFESFRDVVKLGIRAFVGAVANTAGSRTFINWHPHGTGSSVQPTVSILP